MGKHLGNSLAVPAANKTGVAGATRSSSTPIEHSRFHGNLALSLFGFLAAFAFILVNVTDPYAGAVASPYYHAPSDPIAPQVLASAGAYEDATITRDEFTVTEKPKVVVPPPVATTSEGWAPPAAAVPDPGSAQAIAAEKVAARGWGSGEFDCLVALWNRESGWRVNAYNPSGAYGIPQALPGSKMASAGADWETNPATQIEWGLGYVSSRYGSPCGAWQSSEDRGWY